MKKGDDQVWIVEQRHETTVSKELADMNAKQMLSTLLSMTCILFQTGLRVTPHWYCIY